MVFLHQFSEIANTNGFEHSLKLEQDLHISNVAEEISNIFKNVQTPQLIMYEGSMGSGKTTVTTILNNLFPGSRILRLNDERAPDGEMYIRNNLSLRKGSKVDMFNFGLGLNIVKEIVNEMDPGSILFISEAQFMGTNEDIADAIKYAFSKGIHVVCDCLSVYFNGKRVATSQFLKSISNKHFDMWPCDSFESGRGEIPMRVVRIDEDGLIPDSLDKETANYYTSLPRKLRRRIFNKIKASPFKDKLILKENGRMVCLVPSHPTMDADFVPGGNERYFSTSLLTCTRILREAGLNSIAKEYESIRQTEG